MPQAVDYSFSRPNPADLAASGYVGDVIPLAYNVGAPALRKQPGAWPNLSERNDMAQRMCSIDGCERPHDARGWCSTHYYRWKTNGDPLVVRRRRGTLEARLPLCYVSTTEGCWPWIGTINNQGYGTISLGGRAFSGHRLVYESFNGTIPEGLELDHLCRNRACVNPAHLQPVTGVVNILRGAGPTAVNAKRTHCMAGHPFDDVNTYLPPGKPGHRSCRECTRRRNREYKARCRQ